MQQPVFNFNNLTQTSPEAFERYHADNPEVYAKLVEFATAAVDAGAAHIGIGMLYERLRWYTAVEARQDTFKINNNYRAFYARKMMAEYPRLAGIFETRASKADLWGAA